ncbi:hypothetical protein GOODEAATRI_030905 [Goodea atripinnis]|uniref:Uncharacterized protein n=1 Tax=Goodea atripinnis TaxID=208336 RepID=A0ABV0N6M3_9TELE
MLGKKPDRRLQNITGGPPGETLTILSSQNWIRSLGPRALAGLGLGAMLVDRKKGTGGGKEPRNEPLAVTGQRAGLWRTASCSLIWEAWAVCSPGTTGGALSVLLQGLVKDDCASHTWRRAWTSGESVRPSSRVIRAKACRDVSNKP